MDIKKFTNWYKFESYLNIATHLMNASAAFYMTLYSIRQGWQSITWHIFLTTVGYQLLMAEAIMVFYSPNSWTYFHSKRTKKHLHWILQSVGAIFIVVGNVIIIVIKKTPHFKSAHAITGLISMVLLLISVLQGIAAFFALDLKNIIRPAANKFLHNLTSVACFIVGMASLIYGYQLGMMKMYSTDDVRHSMIAFAIITTIFSLFGAMKSSFNFLKTVF